MAKELPGGNDSPGVFQMMNQQRTNYFESEVTDLPHPPTTLPQPLSSRFPKLRKSSSQPQLSLLGSVQPVGTAESAVTAHPAGNLHLHTAVMSSTQGRSPLERRASSFDARDLCKNIDTRYHQLDPNYRSTSILKSFKYNFKLFGNLADSQGRKSVSNPNTPRETSSELLSAEETRERSNSDGSRERRLSLLREEIAELDTGNKDMSLVAAGVKEPEDKPNSKQPSLLGSDRKDLVDGAMAQEKKTPLTRQMMNWFTTPQKSQGTVARSEMNAMTPSSF